MRKIFVLITILINLSFADSIDNLLEKAYQNDFKLKSLEYQKEAQIYKTKQQESYKLPTVNIAGNLGWERYQPYYSNKKTDQTLQYYYIVLRQIIFKPSINLSIQQEKLRENIASLKIDQEKQYISYLFFNMFYDYIYSKEKLDILNQIITAKQERNQIIKDMYMKQLATKEDILRSEIDYINSLQEVEVAKEDYEKFKRAFLYLLNIEDDKDIQSYRFNISIQNFDFLQNQTIDDYLPKIENNYEVMQAKISAQIWEKEVEKRKKEAYPQIGLEGSYMKSSTQATTVAKEDTRLSITLSYPLYDGSYNKNYVLEAENLKKASYLDLEQLKKDKYLELKDYFTAAKSSYKSIQELNNLLEKQTAQKELIKTMIEKQLKTKLDYINADISILQTKKDILDYFHTLIVYYAKLSYTISEVKPDFLKSFINE